MQFSENGLVGVLKRCCTTKNAPVGAIGKSPRLRCSIVMAQPARRREQAGKLQASGDPKNGLSANPEQTLLINEGKLGSRSLLVWQAAWPTICFRVCGRPRHPSLKRKGFDLEAACVKFSPGPRLPTAQPAPGTFTQLYSLPCAKPGPAARTFCLSCAFAARACRSEQACPVAGPHLELGATADFCLVSDVVRQIPVKHRVRRDLGGNSYGGQFF